MSGAAFTAANGEMVAMATEVRETRSSGTRGVIAGGDDPINTSHTERPRLLRVPYRRPKRVLERVQPWPARGVLTDSISFRQTLQGIELFIIDYLLR